jgi:sodium-dependent dicarboxylate transporter 2/3/5
MTGGSEVRTRAESILSNKGVWIGVGLAIFLLVGFILPAPQSLIDALSEYGYVDRMIEWGIADNASEAAAPLSSH